MTEGDAWRKLARMVSGGHAPHAIAAILPRDLAASFRDSYARMLLCREGTGTDSCESCRSWTEDGHPDLVIVGNWGDPPGVADCLTVPGQLSLRPVVAPGRLAVVPSADNLSLPAANSLLKVTEEPPEGGHILFLAEKDGLIPTIRSRVWTVRLSVSPELDCFPAQPPDTPVQWAEWFEQSRKKTLEALVMDVDRWVLWHCGREEWVVAASLQSLLFLAQKRHLPVSMVQDALYALLKEGIHSEQIFGDLREA